jgi:hypothetical protein
MELSNDGDELYWASVLRHNSPKTLSAYSVKSLGQIDVSGIQVGVLFLKLHLQLTCCEHHVDCTAILPEAALTLRREAILKVFNETVKENPR